jgi:nicotinamide riboside kinase
MEGNLKQRQSEIIKIAMFGPESTGKTTLAIQLAEYYKTDWVPEFAREYLQDKWNKNKHICDVNDMLPIAYGQTQRENEKLGQANKYLFCDTNLMVTKVFSEVYYDCCEPLLDKAALEHQYDLFFLTDIDVPWEKDGLRDKAEGRESVFTIFKQSLIDNNKPFITLSGDKNVRLQQAISITNDLSEAKEMGFSSADFVQIYEYGIPVEKIKKQLGFFKNGIPKIELLEPAMLFNGILKLSSNGFQQKAAIFDANRSDLKLLKFVPASGLASRMFSFLTVFLKEFDFLNESINAYINRKKDSELSVFIVGLKKLPFYKKVNNKIKEEFPGFDSLDKDHKNYYFIKAVLASDYFNFANKPKGVLPFHKYKTHTATPIEEHLYESAFYSSANGLSNLHFTVTEGHQSQFDAIVDSVKEKVEKQSGSVLQLSYSSQHKATDTIAVDLENKPFRDENGKLVFRPGGHGALIENLNRLNADVIFIKNIDNVTQGNIEKITLYKKALAGVLIELQQQVFGYLKAIDAGEIQQKSIESIVFFIKEKLNVEIESDFEGLVFEEKLFEIKKALNKPMRVCGMVKNEGEPGGGPFWVRNKNGSVSLQIVEASQVDLSNADQANILGSATHFNPVDLVCGIKNYRNEVFDLDRFVDRNSGFIVNKESNGKKLKGYELPGLWNGAMANWLTVFVEVPLITFNPVKNVNDLLKSAHQPQKSY